jgi:hypothetical protein
MFFLALATASKTHLIAEEKEERPGGCKRCKEEGDMRDICLVWDIIDQSYLSQPAS